LALIARLASLACFADKQYGKIEKSKNRQIEKSKNIEKIEKDTGHFLFFFSTAVVHSMHRQQ
jgi:hypothetical protein